jgi:hypothetical protein
MFNRTDASVVPFRQAKLRLRGTASAEGVLDVGPRWAGGVFLPTAFVVQAGGNCTVDGRFRLMTWSSAVVEPEAHLHLASGFINNGARISCFTGVSIGEGAHIGPDAIVMDMVLKGVTIGDGAVIAAASVVTKDVAPGTLVAGSPARYVRDVTWTP